MKKVIFMGYVVSPEEANQMSGASVAGNKMQWNVLKNLNKMAGISVKSVTITPLAVYPHEKQLFQKSEVVKLDCGVTSVRVPYANLPVLKQFWQIFSVYRAAKKQIKETGANTLFCFNLFPQIGVPMRWLKKKFPELDTVCLLADLPIDDNTQRRGFSVWLRKKFEKSTWKSMAACDRFITLNRYVAEKYLPGKPYIVIDGGVDDDVIAKYETPVEKSTDKNILFCGALTEYNGVMNLIQAMPMVQNPDVCLDIYGSGYLENEVKEAAQKDSRIHYHGRVSNEVVLQKQREAWLLANPRKVDDLISKVTFPSKTFEYLLSGTPVLTTPLETYGPEYKEHMFFAEGDTPEALAKEINEIALQSEDDFKSMGQNSALFIAKSKNWNQQCKIIYQFLMKRFQSR